MSKKLLAGILLGGAATYAAWKKMAPAKKEALKESVDEKINKVIKRKISPYCEKMYSVPMNSH